MMQASACACIYKKTSNYSDVLSLGFKLKIKKIWLFKLFIIIYQYYLHSTNKMNDNKEIVFIIYVIFVY